MEPRSRIATSISLCRWGQGCGPARLRDKENPKISSTEGIDDEGPMLGTRTNPWIIPSSHVLRGGILASVPVHCKAVERQDNKNENQLPRLRAVDKPGRPDAADGARRRARIPGHRADGHAPAWFSRRGRSGTG